MFGDPVANNRGWPVLRLDEVSRNITDGTHDTPTRTPSGIPFITSKNVRPFEFDLSNLEYVSLETHREIIKRCNPRRGDVLYTNIGASVGSAVQNRFDFEFSLKNVALIQPDREHLLSDYLEYMLNNTKFKEALLSSSAAGGAQKFVTLKALRNAPVPIPPVAAQDQFAARVGAMAIPKAQMAEHQRVLSSAFLALQHRAFMGEL
jgi:type I restriction enzyme S subunit